MRVRLIVDDEPLEIQLRDELTEAGMLAARHVDDPDLLIVDIRPADTPSLAELRSAFPRCSLIGLVDPGTTADPPDGCDEVVAAPLQSGALLRCLAQIKRSRREAATPRDRLLAHALSSAADIIEITGPKARYEYVNEAYERVFGYSLEEVVGRTPASVIRSDMHEPGYFEAIDRVLSAGEQWKGVIISRARDGHLVYLEGTISPILDEHGTVAHHIAVKRDITARLEAEKELQRKSEELEQARDAALDASRSKSQFLANMSHELRTPLNAIIGYSEMLAEDAEDAGQTEVVADLGKIRKAGEHLLTLINDVLDISKIEAGAMQLHVERFELKTAVSGVLATLEPLVKESGNALSVAMEEDLGAMRSDLTKVRQTLLNLLSNACKFTSDGNIMLIVRRVDEDGVEMVEFQICDTGIGMSPEHLRRLFRPFEQADASTTRRFGGTGLGLTISQRFCQMLGGHIEAASELGVGSTFTVRLPLRLEAADSTEETSTPQVVSTSDEPVGAGRTVLVIDDDPVVGALLTRSLGRYGFKVESAPDGRRGLERARELQPHAIVLDVMMPELDGWGVLTEIKASPETADIPVVLLTMLEQSEVGFALGAVDYLVKPVQTDRLASVLERHCRASPAKVLIVDDDDASREVFRRTLEAVGHSVTEATNGAEGLEAIEASVPDLIVLDLMMPVLDGFGVLETLRRDERYASIPVVIVTAKDLTASDREMLAGARAVLERGASVRSEVLEVVARRVEELCR